GSPVGNADPVKRSLRTHVEGFLSNIDQLRARGMKGRRGVILAGPPGTGKTLVGKVLADSLGGSLGVSFLWVLPRHIKRPDNIADLLAAARFMAPAVLFFEDLDLFGEDRDETRSPLLGELMNQLDGVNDNDGLVTIATTNRLEIIERALRNRPGRFDRVIELGLPDEDCRDRLLQLLLARSGVAAEVRRRIVQATDGYSPAQLEELVNTMHLLAAEASDHSTPGGGAAEIPAQVIERALVDLRPDGKKAIGFL
ncbi:MAG TPA: ATP-binding protein, partial [Humisphaera sp.]|nr:ATP-binding protein [Humisphaera sp.]